MTVNSALPSLDPLVLPLVPTNVTERSALLEGYIDSVNALSHALEVLRKSAPNACHYNPDAARGSHHEDAMRQHVARLARLDDAMADLRKIGEHVAGLS